MQPFSFRTLALLPLLTSAAVALPATLLPSGEWMASTQVDRLVLVDQATGQVRVAEANGDLRLNWLPPLATDLPGVTDISTGLKGALGEAMAVTEPYANRIALIDLEAATPVVTRLESPQPGPGAICESDQGNSETMLATLLAGGGQGTFLHAIEDLASGGVVAGEDAGYGPIQQLEPLFAIPGNATIAVGRSFSINTQIFLASPDGGGVDFQLEDTLLGEWQIGSSISDENGDTCVVSWRTGGTVVRVYRLSGAPQPGAGLIFRNDPKVTLSGGIGALIRSNVPGADSGFIAISADGSEAKHYRLRDAELIENAVFNPSNKGARINGLLPVEGNGLVQLEGPATGGPSSDFISWKWDGSEWVMTDSGSLSSLLEPQTDFATLFYFDSEPFLSESAVLLGLEMVPDWTRGSTGSPFPATIPRAIYDGDSSGLIDGGSLAFSAPSGSSFLLTNQHREDLSISALRADSEILTPPLVINPPSGTSATTVEVSALYDSERQTLFYRDASPFGVWTEWSGALAVAYSSEWLFRLEDQVSGQSGPIVSRSWTINPANLTDTDSDADGVPDFVETEFGLDPFGGADSDGDGASDLEELLEGSDPADAASLPSPRNPVAQGDGAAWLVDAGNHLATAVISNGEMITAHDISGGLLANEPVTNVSHPSLGNLRAAQPSTNEAPTANEWALLLSPVYFDIGSGINPLRSGREVVRLVPVPGPQAPDIVFSPSGTDSSADAAGWLAAAMAAYASWHPVSEVTRLRPEHTLTALLCEAIVHGELSSQALFPAPAPQLSEFTLFPGRTQDAARTPFDPSLVAGLTGLGFDFPTLLASVEAAVDGVGSDVTTLRALADAVYAFHIANSDANPGLPLPLPVLRAWIAGDGLDPAYVGVASPAELASAESAVASILALGSSGYRPVATWSAVVLPQGEQPVGVVERVSDDLLVALLRPDGSPFPFEQGLGVRAGSTLTVTGFTDVSSPTGYPAMEVTALAFTGLPAESARDQDANLLDDEWERFFFGSTGNDPYSSTGASSFTLLEHYLAGTDPRGGDDPAGQPADLSPPTLDIAPIAPDQFQLSFDFPDNYADQIDFIIECSPDLSPGSFVEIATTTTSLGEDAFTITLPPSAPGDTGAFYRLRLALP